MVFLLEARRSLSVTGCIALVALTACEPPGSVQSVQGWLDAYIVSDVEGMVSHTWFADQSLLRDALSTKTSSLALFLPPQPLSYELLEIEKKSADGNRHVVLCRVTMKNPLAFMSEKVGQKLDIPKTRTRRRRFLSVRGPDGHWGVKLDLPRVLARTRFIHRFERALRARRFDTAERLLENVPPPPDEANAQQSKDRLRKKLQTQLAAARHVQNKAETSTRAKTKESP